MLFQTIEAARPFFGLFDTQKNGYRGIFPLPVDAPCLAKRFPQNQVLRFSPSMQQKTHHVSPDSSAGMSIQDVQEDKGTGKNHLSAMQGNNENHLEENSKTAKEERMFYIIRNGELMM